MRAFYSALVVYDIFIHVDMVAIRIGYCVFMLMFQLIDAHNWNWNLSICQAFVIGVLCAHIQCELNVFYKLFHAHTNMTTRFFFFDRCCCSLCVCVMTNSHGIYLFFSFTNMFISIFHRCSYLFMVYIGWNTSVYCININYGEQSVLMLQLISSMNITSISLVFVFFVTLCFPSSTIECTLSNMSIYISICSLFKSTITICISDNSNQNGTIFFCVCKWFKF